MLIDGYLSMSQNSYRLYAIAIDGYLGWLFDGDYLRWLFKMIKNSEWLIDNGYLKVEINHG